MKEKNNSLLWRLTGASLPGVSYVFGTMHVRDRRAFRLLLPVMDYIRECEALATEFALDEASLHFDPSLLQLPDAQTLEELIPDKKYRKLRKIVLKTTGLDIHLLRDKKPIIIANLIDERILARDMPVALDQELWHFARREGKILYGIETYREQLQILQKIPIEDQLKALLAIGRNISRHRKHLLRMTALYEQGNIRQLYQSARRGAQGLRRLMLYDRNALMAERIGRLIRRQPTFCAVGAAHLAGGKGVLRLLKHQQLRVEPVDIAEPV